MLSMRCPRRLRVRLWGVACIIACAKAADLVRATHASVQRVTQCVVEDRSFNVAISELMVLSNTIEATLAAANDSSGDDDDVTVNVPTRLAALLSYRALVLMLSPFAPHLMAEVWNSLLEDRRVASVVAPIEGGATSEWSGYLKKADGAEEQQLASTTTKLTVHDQAWPAASATYLDDASTRGTVDVAVSVMGKFRGMLSVPIPSQQTQMAAAAAAAAAAGDVPTEDDVTAAVRESELGRWLEGEVVTRTIIRPTKDRCIVNFVLEGGGGGEGGKKKKKKKKKTKKK